MSIKKILSLLALSIMFCSTFLEARGIACDESTAELVATAYVYSIPLMGLENELIPLMESNPGYFNDNGPAIRCMQNLGAALINSGLIQADIYNQGPNAIETFGPMPEGLEGLPGQVDASIQSYSAEIITMGQELLWLAQVLPPAAVGNYTPYNSTGTTNRQQVAQIMPIYQMLCQMDPSICQIMVQQMHNIAPQIRQQIYTLALQFGN